MLTKMMFASTVATVLLCLTAIPSVSATAYDYPSFDIFHSHCGLNVKYENTLCVDVYNNIINVLNNFNAGQDPAKGTYQFKERQAISYIWMLHKSQSSWVDDVIFETLQLNDGCQITGRSRTQSTFHSAGEENYCNLWNVYNAVGSFTGLSANSCSSQPSDPVKSCIKQ